MDDSHHAYVYFARSLAVLPDALRQPSVDVVHTCVDSLSIADSRKLSAVATSRPVQATHKSVVVQFQSATVEAQNALLKLLEEPPPTTRFFLVVPRPEALLETVRSRLIVSHQGEAASTEVWHELQTRSLAEQLQEITERSKQKDVVWQQQVLVGAVTDTGVPATTRSLIDHAVYAPGASRKMLLEELVLAVANPAAARYNAPVNS